ncbi:hypothetical protein COOONC_11874 [Cooperia oncophora]
MQHNGQGRIRPLKDRNRFSLKNRDKYLCSGKVPTCEDRLCDHHVPSQKNMAHNVFQTTAEALLVLCYSFVLTVIITSKAKEFKSAFFSIYVATGFADIASLISCWFVRFNREVGLGEDFHDILLACVAVTSATFVAHMFGNMLITINRYSAVCHMRDYNVIWTKKRVWMLLALQYIMSFAAFVPMIGTRLNYGRNEEGNVVYKGMEKHLDLLYIRKGGDRSARLRTLEDRASWQPANLK